MRGFTALLTVTTFTTYLLVVLGATTASTGSGGFRVGHYLVAGLVSMLVIALFVRSWLENRDRRVRIGATATVVAVPTQAIFGMALVGNNPALGGSIHLFGGIIVFGLLLLTLVWHLESEVAVVAENGDEVVVDQSLQTTECVESDSSPSGKNPRSTTRFIPEQVWSYIALTKPRLMWLLCLLALAGMALTATVGASLDGVTIVATLAGGTLAIGSAGTFNHVYERDRDRRMRRTADRPLATDAVDPRRATLFGLALFVGSMAIFLLFVNPLAAGLTAVAAAYYAVLYTVVLKPSTTWNTVLGGGAGALPAVIGWAAITGEVGLPALLLAAVVFCWTPAHFYNLAIACRDDYAEAGYPMLPVVKGVAFARRRILYWLGVTLLLTAGLATVAGFSVAYGIISAVAGLWFLWTVAEQYQTDTDQAAYRSFYASNAYLGAVLFAILFETMVI